MWVVHSEWWLLSWLLHIWKECSVIRIEFFGGERTLLVLFTLWVSYKMTAHMIWSYIPPLNRVCLSMCPAIHLVDTSPDGKPWEHCHCSQLHIPKFYLVLLMAMSTSNRLQRVCICGILRNPRCCQMDGRQSGKERAANLLSGMVFCFNCMLEFGTSTN